jgi:uncharacterized protein (TIRG00374 family)
MEARVQKTIRLIFVLTIAGALIYLALGVWVGWQNLSAAMAKLGFGALAAGMLVSTLSYSVRFIRWQHVLLTIGAPVPAMSSFRVYLSGLALTATPAKVGETVRSMLLLRWNVPIGSSLAAFFVDRLTDLIAVMIIAGLTSRAPSIWLLFAAFVACLGFAMRWVFTHHYAERLATWLTEHRVFRFLSDLLRTGMRSYLTVWRPLHVLYYACLAVLAYGMQALVFAVYVNMLWPASDVLRSVCTFATSALVGAATLIPGGLGATEITMIGMLSADGMPIADATAATVAMRIVTLWFGILIGVSCLASFRRLAVDAVQD